MQMAGSPSNAATANYFKVFSKPKPSITKSKHADVGAGDVSLGSIHDVRPRGGSVSKAESARAAEKHHRRRGTAGAVTPAATWGLNLISTQLTTDPKQPSRQQNSNTNPLLKKKSERGNPATSTIPVVQIDQKSFLKSKRSVDKIERARNMMFAELEAEKKVLPH